jgi:hypothetical protein
MGLLTRTLSASVRSAGDTPAMTSTLCALDTL